jgi:hypothetical protein
MDGDGWGTVGIHEFLGVSRLKGDRVLRLMTKSAFESHNLNFLESASPTLPGAGSGKE